MSDAAAVSDARMADDENNFSLESLEEPLKSYAQQALTSSASPTSKYDTLEVQLRQYLLSSTDLSKDWETCRKLCIHILAHSDLNLRRIPFVLLEDLVETLDLDKLQQFWDSIHMEALCSGILWETSTGNSHVLQWIRLQNALLKRLPNKGSILMTMAKILPLSDRSSIKLWGAVAGNTVEFENDQDYKLEITQGDTTPLPYSFYEIFWSLQHDMANPYAISFSNFFPSAKKVLAVMESKPLLLTATDDDSSSSRQVLTQRYLTRGRLLPLQLQDSAFRQSWLTQFLIVESFISSQSTALQTTLTDLSNRAKQLLRKIPNGEPYVDKLEWILSERETMWRTWKKNKCKPDLERCPTEEENAQSNKHVSQPLRVPQPPRHFCLEDLALEKSMAIPNVYEHLEEYVDALDPDAGIEAEYHPKHASNFCWKTLRLLARQHLNHFDMIRKRDGDFERMVRTIYKERNVHIPGEAPPEEEDYDHDAENKVVDEEPTPVIVDVAMEEDVEEKEIAALEETIEENDEKQIQETAKEPIQEPEKNDAASSPVPKEEEGDASEEMEEASAPIEPYAGEDQARNDEDKMDAKTEQDEFKNEAPEDAAKLGAKTEPDESKNEALDDAAKADAETEQDQTKDEPSEPLTAFEKAAMEEEALLLAEGEERKKSQESEDNKSKQEPTQPETQKSDDTKSKQEQTRGVTQEEDTLDDRKRKHSSPGTNESTKRPRVGGIPRNDDRGRRDDENRRGGWGGRGPPPPSHRGLSHRGGRGDGPTGRGGDGPGMRRGGPPPTRGGRVDDGRRAPRGRDTRRRY